MNKTDLDKLVFSGESSNIIYSDSAFMYNQSDHTSPYWVWCEGGTSALGDWRMNLQVSATKSELYLYDPVDGPGDYFRIEVDGEADTDVYSTGDLRVFGSSELKLQSNDDVIIQCGVGDNIIIQESTTGDPGDVTPTDDKHIATKKYVDDVGDTKVSLSYVQEDDTFASASSTAIASSESIKVYVDNEVAGITPDTSKYYYETKAIGFYANVGTANYLPLNGYIIESTLSAGRNEYQAMVAPYDGVIAKAMFRSEYPMDGDIEFDIYEAVDETEIPGTVVGNKVVFCDRINDDVSVDFNFGIMDSGSNALTKGNIYTIKLTTPSAPYDTNVTLVLKWDVTT